MNDLIDVRRWARSGPVRERVATALVAALLIGLMVWTVTPLERGGEAALAAGEGTTTPTSTAGLAQPGATVPGGSDALGPGVTVPAGSAPTGAAGAAGAAGPVGPTATTTPGGRPSPGPAAVAGGCDNTATDVGVTKDEVKVGVVLVDLGSLNAGLGIDPVANQISFYNALFGDLNAKGGLQCRKVVAKYYSDNVLDAAGEHSACLQMVQDRVFAVLNNFFSPGETTCVSRQKIPNIWYTPVHTPSVRSLYPYLMAYRADYDSLIRNYVFGLEQYGFFKGAGRVGLLTDSCSPDVSQAVLAALARIGYDRTNMSVYDYGCPGAITTPDRQFAAALQMKRDGVTNVLSTAYGVIGGFADAAANQGLRPRYGLMDDNAAELMQAANPPPNPSLDGALMITADQTGAENTPGSTFSQATRDCISVGQRTGNGSPLQPHSTAAGLRGLACANVQLLAAVAARTRPLVRAGLAPTMGTLGSIDLAFPAGPNNFLDPKLPVGGQFWRPIRYLSECHCFRLADGPTWHASFR